MVPLGGMLRDRPSARLSSDLSLRAALDEAAGERGFWLLCLGFFVCGFQVVFIGVHLPGYLFDNGLAVQVGSTVLALVGLFNIFGTYAAGWLGGIYSKPRLLSWLYLTRGAVITAFVFLPLSPASAYLFGVAMGLLWLSTVPLTNGIVASVFGVRHLSMLGGIVFLFHQLGSFMGVWMGGYLYDLTGHYDVVWKIAILLSVVAALLHWFISEAPVKRPTPTEVQA
ncbi:MFS transporter [Halomonas sp. BC04]|nr:MFS transporter [Halomonas sp. BC04]